MNVGQVEFSVKGDGLDATLQKAKELQTILNGIDNKTVGAKAGSVAKSAGTAATASKEIVNNEKAYNRAVQQSLRNDKQRQKQLEGFANQEIKTRNLELKERLKTSKRIARLDRDEARRNDAIAKMNVKNANRRLNERLATAKRVAKVENDNRKAEEARSKAQANSLVQSNKEIAEWQRGWARQQANIGAQMQTFGAAMQRVTSPFVNIYKGITMGIGYRLMYKMMDSIQGAFSRYDTMKTYGIVLKELGMDASKKFAVGTGNAMTAIENLEQAVLGLPTGLDEIVASMKVYAGATGDVEKATKLAIAANNAFIAGGMDARQQIFTQRQLLSLAGGAELSSNQWDSLRRNAPLAIRAVAKEMGKDVQSMIDGLKSGSIAGKEFLDTFVKVGTEGQLKNAAQKMKQTWDSVSQNMQNAMNRAGEGILKTLDEVFEKTDGRNFLQHVLGVDKNGEYIGGGIRGAIDNMTESAKKWIKANPDAITNFFDNLSKIDFASIAGGFARFALTMGRVYAWLGKVVGSGKLVQAMLWTNIAGKIIQTTGGFVKGTAFITSWFAAFMHFKGVHKVATTAGKIYKSGGAIVGATRTMATVALTWQQVASKALNIGAIYVVAQSFKVMAKAMQEFGKVNWDANTIGNLGTATLALGGMTKFITSLGATLGAAINSPLGKYILGGTAAVELVLLGIGKTMEMIGKGFEGLSSGIDAIGKLVTMKLPTAEKVSQVSQYITELSKAFNDNKNPFEYLQSSISAWTKGLRAGSIKKIADAMDSIKRLSEVKIKEDAFQQAKDNFAKIQEFAINLVDLFEGEDEKARKKTSKGGVAYTPRDIGMNGKAKGSNTYPEWQNKIKGFAEQVKSLADSLGYVDTILTTVDTLNKHYVKFGRMKDGTQLKFDWDIVYKRIARVSKFISSLVAPEQNGIKSPLMQLKEAADQLKGGQFSQISEALGQIPKVIRLFDRIQEAMTNSGLFGGEFASPTSLDWGTSIDPLLGIRGANQAAGINFANRLKPIFSALQQITTMIPDPESFKGMKSVELSLNRIKTVIGQLGELSNIDTSGISIEGIQGVAQKIKDALAEVKSLGDDGEITVAITVNGDVTDNATDKINEAHATIKKALDSLEKLSKPKDVTVSVHVDAIVTGVTAAVQKINDAIAKIRDALSRLSSAKAGAYSAGRAPDNPGGHPVHTGGKIQYRAHGGEIYKTRGTDSVPAMLTPGEWVINRRSSSLLGDNVLWKLNHMDIRGAINALSSRFGAPSSIVNNTYNRNIGGITLNNGNSASVGLERTSKWVKGL